ncbi:MAG TPA: hypothetical protein VFB84_08285 [Micromonosporaceae bacterium]|nr:hypothetical protein [Micromonosporaceae bacterium]
MFSFPGALAHTEQPVPGRRKAVRRNGYEPPAVVAVAVLAMTSEYDTLSRGTSR